MKGWWVEGLLSGRFPQGLGSLHTLAGETAKEGFCCLGVLCEVALAHGLSITTKNGSLGELIAEHAFYDGYGQYLPPSVAKWAGLYDDVQHMEQGCNPAVRIDAEFVDAYAERFGNTPPWSPDDVVELAELNDSPIQFDLIAGLVERSL